MKTIRLPFKLKKPVLACGADMKGAFALAAGDVAYLDSGFGDLGDPANMARYEKAVRGCEKRLGIRPSIVVCDHHPGYFSTQFAQQYGLSRWIPELYDTQHHEAHVASAMADNRLSGKVIGVAFDGTGLGWDGCTWGGEFFTGSPRRFRRAGHFEYVPMPGGDAAVREPWRMAAAHLYGVFGDKFMDLKIDFMRKFDRRKWPVVKRMVAGGINSPLTSSAGRLFDAAASVILCRMKADFEAELPIALENIAAKGRFDHYGFDIRAEGDNVLIGYRKLFEGIVKDIENGMAPGTMSAKFHNTVAQMIADVCSRLKRKTGIDRVVLTGGVFQNRYLTAKAAAVLKRKGFKVYTHFRVETNDSGIPLGQIAIAHARGVCA